MADYDVLVEVDERLDDPVDVQAVAAAVEATLAHQHVANASVTVVLATDEEVQVLNLQYRGVDAPTDVLSFAAQEGKEDAPALVLPEELAGELQQYLGDLVIAYPYSKRQADHYGNSVTAELQLLAVHGTLHLLGYDHQDADAEAAMWTLQEAILARFGVGALVRRAYDD